MKQNYLPLIFFLFMILGFVESSIAQQKADYNTKLKELGIELFTPTKPQANYVKAVRTGKLIFLAGHGSTKADGTVLAGKVGDNISLEEGVSAARSTVISLLSTLKAEIGDLNKVKRIVKVTGWVNCTSDFVNQSKVMNGCSDLLVSVFGNNGLHARSSIGTNALPNNFICEIEMIVELK